MSDEEKGRQMHLVCQKCGGKRETSDMGKTQEQVVKMVIRRGGQVFVNDRMEWGVSCPVCKTGIMKFDSVYWSREDILKHPGSAANLFRKEQGLPIHVDRAAPGTYRLALAVIGEDGNVVRFKVLKANWSMEASRKLKEIHGLDVSGELAGVIGTEIGEALKELLVDNK